MANKEHVALLKQGGKVWNAWLDENRNVALLEQDLDAWNAWCDKNPFYVTNPDLTNADLRGAFLTEANLCEGRVGSRRGPGFE